MPFDVSAVNMDKLKPSAIFSSKKAEVREKGRNESQSRNNAEMTAREKVSEVESKSSTVKGPKEKISEVKSESSTVKGPKEKVSEVKSESFRVKGPKVKVSRIIKPKNMTNLQWLIQEAEDNFENLSKQQQTRLKNMKELQQKLDSVDDENNVLTKETSQYEEGREPADQIFEKQELDDLMSQEQLEVQNKCDESVVDISLEGQEVEVCQTKDLTLFVFKKITVSERDYESVADPEGWLTDQVVDFWIQFQYAHLVDSELKMNVAVFTSDFFLFLTGAYKEDPIAMCKWSKNTDLFNSIVTIFPIIVHHHWWAVVLLGLRTRYSPIFVVLDSLGVREEQTEAIKVIWSFVCKEWSGEDTVIGPLPTCIHPTVPLQKEGYSCGVRLAMNVEAIMKDPVGYAQSVI